MPRSELRELVDGANQPVERGTPLRAESVNRE